jgi:hypothetical protein
VKVTIVLELELAPSASDLSDEAIDTWAWALEREVETLDLVEKATVVDLTEEAKA